MKNPFSRLLLLIVDAYQILISPFLGSNCRFYPTCSAYTKEAISKKGIFIGVFMSISRILRCNPLCNGGFDPVIKEPNNSEEK